MNKVKLLFSAIFLSITINAHALNADELSEISTKINNLSKIARKQSLASSGAQQAELLLAGEMLKAESLRYQISELQLNIVFSDCRINLDKTKPGPKFTKNGNLQSFNAGLVMTYLSSLKTINYLREMGELMPLQPYKQLALDLEMAVAPVATYAEPQIESLKNSK